VPVIDDMMTGGKVAKIVIKGRRKKSLLNMKRSDLMPYPRLGVLINL